jgi:hypothetical protein
MRMKNLTNGIIIPYPGKRKRTRSLNSIKSIKERIQLRGQQPGR